MADIVLLYSSDCPNVEQARANLNAALSLSTASEPPSWREVELSDPSTPAEWRTLGSPSVLVDGEDIMGASPGQGSSCRLYDGLTRAPSVDAIARALRRHGEVLGKGEPPCASGRRST